MRLPGNLSARLLAILLIGFIAWQLLLVLATSLPSHGTDERPYGLPRAAEAAAMVAALERSPPAEQPALVALFDQGLYSVTLSSEGVRPSPHVTTPDLVLLGRFYAAALPGHAVAVDARRALLGEWLGTRPRPARLFAPVQITISLADGRALVLTSRPSAPFRAFLRRRSAIGLVSGLLLLGMLLLAMRRETRPITRLAQGVRAFGADLDAPPLRPEGSPEVRDLALAFNDMRGRIRALMAERTRTLAAIAHDMRTYLTRLRLRADYIDDADHRDRAVRDIEEMTALLDDTLLLASADGAEAVLPDQAMDLREAVAVALQRREDRADALRAELAEGAVMVRARPLGVRRILDNLIDNGLRHAGEVTVTLAVRGGQAALIVADNGPGVDPALLARLGEPFSRLDPSRNRESGGAGLGLAIVRALAARDGGEVSFENRVTGGLQVTVRYSVEQVG